MRKTFTWAITVICVVLMLIVGCGNNSSNVIVGRWKSNTDSDVFYNTIEFFGDGTYITETAGWSGTYTTDGNRLRLSGRLYNEVFTFETDNKKDELTLVNEKGYSKVYRKVN